MWCNRLPRRRRRHLRIFIHTWSRTQLDGENTRIGRTHGRRSGASRRRRERERSKRGRKGGSYHLLRFVDDRPRPRPTFAHLSSSLRIRIDNDRWNDDRDWAQAGAGGRAHEPDDRDRPGYGHMQWPMEGGERGRDADGRTRTGVSKYAKDDPKAELTETANANARFLSSSRFLSKSKYDSARAHRAADSRRWKDAKNSPSPRGIALSHSDYSVRVRARWREPSFYVFRSNFFATLSWQIRRTNARPASTRSRTLATRPCPSSNWLIPDITSCNEEDEGGGETFSR